MKMRKSPMWWETDEYTIDSEFLPQIGEKKVATVIALPDGRTGSGWSLSGVDGKPGFMANYRAGQFTGGRAERRFRAHGKPLAYIMRSTPLICIDVDGKNDGFASLPQLGPLPPTLAETSKSGNGLHFFYLTEEKWDDELGYADFGDSIGIATGIDVRDVGCVYHHSTQRWNTREPAPLPDFLAQKLLQRKHRREERIVAASQINDMDVEDRLMAQHVLVQELNKPITSGSRNNTIFAVGCKLKAAGIEGWEDLVLDRALAVGLERWEGEKIVRNIAKTPV